MSEKFTKGEWSISDIKNESYGYSATIVSKEQMATIAELKATTTSMVDWLPNAEGFKANLALFKAAPKMYRLLDDMSNLMVLLDPQTHPNIELDAVKYDIDALLAEARGEMT